MLFLLRKIRRKLMDNKKITSYLLYALGEIILVVIGILIAVNLNNWNQNQKDIKAEKRLLTKVLRDLETDASSLKKNQETAINIAELHQDCFAIILNDKTPNEVSLKSPNMVRRTMYYVQITKENHPELINQLIDEEIKEAVATYYHWLAMTHALYIEFEDVVHIIRRTISLKDGHNLRAMYKKSHTSFKIDTTVTLITRESLLQLLEDSYFQQLIVESNLKLQDCSGALDSLAANNSKLRAMINEKLAQ